MKNREEPEAISNTESNNDVDTNVDISVVIPTFNGAERLPSFFNTLKSLIIPTPLQWEIIVVDNNSSDRTPEVIRSWQDGWMACPFRYGFEPRQGAAYARKRGIQLARGRFVIFVDDDNFLEPQWLLQAWMFAKDHPQAGAIAGPVQGDYASPPPANFDRIEGFLAVRTYPHYQDQTCQFSPQSLQLPPSAALWVNRAAWLDAVPEEQLLTGKTPQLLVQGDDYEPLLYLHKAGWEIWFHPALISHHQIPPWRLQQSYLVKLAQGCGLATYALRRINTPPSKYAYLAWRTYAGSLKRLLTRSVKWLVAPPSVKKLVAVELGFSWGEFLSPVLFQKVLLPNWRSRLNQQKESPSQGNI